MTDRPIGPEIQAILDQVINHDRGAETMAEGALAHATLMITDLVQETNRLRTALQALLRQYEVDWAKWTNSPASFTEIIQAREALKRQD